MARRAIITLLLASLVVLPAAAQTKKEPHRKEAPAPAPAPAAKAGEDPVIARVNGEALHRSQILLLKSLLAPQVQQQPMDQLYPKLLDQLVSLTLVSQAARKVKIDADPIVKERIGFADNQVLQDAYFGDMMKKDITSEKLHARYDEFVKKEPTREEVDARHILVPTEAEAKAIIVELNKGADFATLAREKTTDPAGKTSGGDLGWFAKSDMVPEFADAAFKLKKGEYTQTPVKTQFGWHVIKIEDQRTGKPPTYEQLAPKIAQQMAQEIAGARIKELASAAKIEVFRPDGTPIPPQQHPRPTEPMVGAPPPSLSPLAGPSGGAPAPGVPTLAPATENLGKGN